MLTKKLVDTFKKVVNINKAEIYRLTHSLQSLSLQCNEEHNLTESAIDNDHFKDLPNPCDAVDEDLSEVVPYFPPTFNLASYVNKSETLQKLVQLGVNLNKIEKKPIVAEKILKLDFERDISKHILFMTEYLELQEMGKYITKNPLILCESLSDLEVRVNYLKSKNFTDIQVKRIISNNPFWLMFSTLRIDRRLGHFQDKFNLQGGEVRYLSTKMPRIITYSMHHINTNTFTVKEEMGFEDNEVKQLLLSKPKIFMLNQQALLERFKYLHNVIKIPHSILLENAEVLLCRLFRVKQRHIFLKQIGRDQFNPQKPNFVPIKALVEDTDSEFCKKYAKCTVDDFNLFLKTL